MRIVKAPGVRRAEILSVAYELFVKKGYEKTSVKDIIDKTGIAKGTLYHYFKSKEDILDTIIEQMIDLIIGEVEEIASGSSVDAHGKLRRILQKTNAEVDQNEPLIAEIHRRDNEKIHIRALNALILKLAPVLAGIVQQGIDEGAFMSSKPLEAVEFLLTGHQYLFDSGFAPWSYDEYERRALSMGEIFEKVLGARQGSMDYVSELLIGRFKAYQNTKQVERKEEFYE